MSIIGEVKNKKKIDEQFEDLKKDILVRLREALNELSEYDFPFDFHSNCIHEIIHEEVDAFVTGFTREDCISWIDFCDNEKYVDKGVIDTSSIDRTLITTAFECIRMKLFDDDLFFELQECAMTEEKRNAVIRRINDRIGDATYSGEEDNETQIFVELDFDLHRDDFPTPYFAENQVIELAGKSLKIFTNNYEINRNAIVIEHVTGNTYRIYLMEKDDDIDIRDFFKYTPSIKEMNYKLIPQLYVDGQLRKHFKEEDKKEFIYYINQMANRLTEIGDMKWRMNNEKK